MDSIDTALPEFVMADGPHGLMKVLENLLHQSEQDEAFRAQEHYIMYQLKDQRSLIKVDMSERPFQFWYYDLMGRPATTAVKEVIAEFLWEKCGEKQRYLDTGRE